VERLGLVEVARAASDAMARRITPMGTQYDGDIVFAVSAGELPAATPLMVEQLALRAAETAIERAVRMARGTKDVPGLAE
jgi:L-aminopeptidase/D-esterase-like protein